MPGLMPFPYTPMSLPKNSIANKASHVPQIRIRTHLRGDLPNSTALNPFAAYRQVAYFSPIRCCPSWIELIMFSRFFLPGFLSPTHYYDVNLKRDTGPVPGDSSTVHLHYCHCCPHYWCCWVHSVSLLYHAEFRVPATEHLGLPQRRGIAGTSRLPCRYQPWILPPWTLPKMSIIQRSLEMGTAASTFICKCVHRNLFFF